jgi:malto-oligosyltrehalose synthase
MQLAGIGFRGARAQVGYLHELGIETLYVSPILAAVPGSTHGYDVIDPCRLDPCLGTAGELEALLGELSANRMRLLVDIVPNHMAANPANRWWWEILRDGRGSQLAAVFDIDWDRHHGRVMVPSLSRPLSDVRETARTVAGDGAPMLELDGQLFPLSADTDIESDIETVIDKQHYRAAYWRLNRYEGNYRRFFDVDGLIGVRVEDAEVFERTHRLIAELCADERVAGVRVDHIDGLSDPATYLERLRTALAGRSDRAVVLVEKILAGVETMRADWAVDGTTGYEFANLAGGLFVEAAGARSLAGLGAELTGETQSFGAFLHEGKREALAQSFPAPLERLGRLALVALGIDEPGHDLSLADLSEALGELTVHLDVYRTYLDKKAADPRDRKRIDKAARDAVVDAEARRAMGLVKEGLLDGGRDASPWHEVAQRWQQLTGAVMAKGVEDTATFRYSGLLSHAEVGCDPDHSSASPDQFHRLVRAHLRRRSSLNATSTHDSKRNEDARARLFVLSEAVDDWASLVRRWHRRHAKWRRAGPDTHDELVAYQTLAALWPFDAPELSEQDCRRAQDYAVKTREAKWRTTWVDPNPSYEAAVSSFIGTVVRESLFTKEMSRFLARIGPAAVTNSLSLVVLKVVTPGVPDFYQDTELLEPTLTDPDNRRPIDYDSRRRLLNSLPPIAAPGSDQASAVRGLLGDWPDGRIKLFTIRALLHLRRARPRLFDKGAYEVLPVRGAHAEHVIAVARRHSRSLVVALAPRLTLGIAGPGRFPIGQRVWDDTTVILPDDVRPRLTDQLTGITFESPRGRLRVSDALGLLPVSVLTELHD